MVMDELPQVPTGTSNTPNMSNPPNSPNIPNLPITPQYQPPEKETKLPLLIAGAVVLALAFGVGGFITGRLSSPKATESDTTASVNETPTDWEKLPSSKKGFPIPGSGTGPLTYYSVDEDEVISLEEVKVGRSGNAVAGIGSSDPIASPDLFYIAYIGEDNNLWLFSNEAQEARQLTSSGFVSHITGWSPDNQHILYYHNHKTLTNAISGNDESAPTTITFEPQVEQGFYVASLQTGKATPLAAVKYTEGFIDDNTLLIKASRDSKDLVTLNIDTLEADLALLSTEAGFGVGQFSFSSNTTFRMCE